MELLRGMRCKVNLIALNPGPGIDFATPEAERVAAFQTILREAGIPRLCGVRAGGTSTLRAGNLSVRLRLPHHRHRRRSSLWPDGLGARQFHAQQHGAIFAALAEDMAAMFLQDALTGAECRDHLRDRPEEARFVLRLRRGMASVAI